mgnify:FL=1
MCIVATCFKLTHAGLQFVAVVGFMRNGIHIKSRPVVNKRIRRSIIDCPPFFVTRKFSALFSFYSRRHIERFSVSFHSPFTLLQPRSTRLVAKSIGRVTALIRRGATSQVAAYLQDNDGHDLRGIAGLSGLSCQRITPPCWIGNSPALASWR